MNRRLLSATVVVTCAFVVLLLGISPVALHSPPVTRAGPTSNSTSEPGRLLPLSTGPYSATLNVNPGQVQEGQSINLQVNVNGGTSPYTYSFTGLPPGCTNQNSPSFSCNPSASGNYNLAVGVTDAHQNQTTSNSVSVQVTSSSSGNGNGGGGGNNSTNPLSSLLSGLGGFLSIVLVFGIIGFITWILLVVGVWIIAIVLFRRLPKRGEAPAVTPTIRCAACGASIPNASKFCSECGRATGPKT
ncbi:MAG: hypothetical protein L3K02_05075 [Thermoplasmata archaeon]|nr:hypothetical protein [Thermoplasmata archaeon]